MTSKWAVAALAIMAGLAVQPARAQEPGGGIRVHGHWTIEVRDADGHVASRTEFDNALTPEGSAALIRVMARRGQFGPWRVTMSGSAVTGGAPFEAMFTQGGAAAYPGSADLTASADGIGVVLLAGETTFTQARDVRDVLTQSRMRTPQGQMEGSFTAFTSKRLPSAIRVAAGQVVRVEVSISFGS